MYLKPTGLPPLYFISSGSVLKEQTLTKILEQAQILINGQNSPSGILRCAPHPSELRIKTHPSGLRSTALRASLGLRFENGKGQKEN